MSWQNPAAFLGLLALVVPVLVHLLTRRRTRVLAFPTLRFIAPSRLLPVRALRPSDLALLALRCAIIILAVTALAAPRFGSGERSAANDALVRVIVVDTSASMQRATVDPAQEAARLAAEADVSLIVPAAVPESELGGAAEWLHGRPGRREIVIVSDFQTHFDAAGVPEDIGLDFVRIPADTAAASWTERRAGLAFTVRSGFDDDATIATWSVAADSTPSANIVAPGGEPLIEAVRPFIATTADTSRAVAVVFPGIDPGVEVRPPDAPWMGDVAAAAGVRAGAATMDGRERLVLFADVDPASVEAAELLIAAGNALAPGIPAIEHDPATIPDARLDAWRRPPASAAPGDPEGESDGRWLWLIALCLLGIETLVRRPRVQREQTTNVEEEAYERVA